MGIVTDLLGKWVRIRSGIKILGVDGQPQGVGGSPCKIVSVYLLNGNPRYTLIQYNGDLIELDSTDFQIMVGDIVFPEVCKLES